jgi:hypothetical protein
VTESEFAPWTIIEGTSRWHERKRGFDTIIETLEHRLGDAAPPREEFEAAILRDADLRAVNKTLEHGREGGE